MTPTGIVMRVCLIRKRITLSRNVIKSLGNPTHLGFWYDESNGSLTFSPAARDDMDAFEIPQNFWNRTNSSCVIARIAFLLALKYRAGWEEGSRYVYNGALEKSGNTPTVVFSLTEGMRLK